MRTHSGEKPFPCTECTKSFKDGGNLKKHLQSHSGEKYFQCTICTKSFTHSGNLKRHMRTHLKENLTRVFYVQNLFGRMNV